MEDILQKCERILGYGFNDRQLLERALTHSSVARSREESNERMEFLGDAVLGLVVCQALYERDERLGEGEMTRIKSWVVSRETCAQVSIEHGITELMSLGKGLTNGGALPQSISAALLEALIGAVYLDGGLEPARELILRLVGGRIERALGEGHQKNYKSALQQHAQRRWGVTPEYVLLDEKGPDHDKAFEVAVAINGKHFPSAWGKTKKDAEQEAARLALSELGLLTGSDKQEDDE
ncbi:MAG: ribonuclease III [Phycisphaerae bacterium]